MSQVYFDPEFSDNDRRKTIFGGGLVVLSPTRSSLALVDLAKEMLQDAFQPYTPQTAHNHLSAESVAAILSVVKPAFIHHPECKILIPMILAEHGMELEELYFDVPRLRSAYPLQFLSSGIAYAYHPHRDTWYSAPMCQINWWLPIYPVDAENAMGFYPDYFDEPVKNNSADYNYYEWNTKSRSTAALHVKSDTREQPKPQEPLRGPSLRLLPAPGSIILFSGAHLHETVPNTTDVARYSIDFRTVHFQDLATRAGATNVDARCTGTTVRDFQSATTGALLPEGIVNLYDDGTVRADHIVRFGERHAHANGTQPPPSERS